MTALHSFGDQIHNELVLLAPAGFASSRSRSGDVTSSQQTRAVAERRTKAAGQYYLADGAVQSSQLSADGRHVQHADYDSWHVLTVDGKGAVQGCARYRHLIGNVGFDDLRGARIWLAQCRSSGGGTLRAAVESEIVRAKQRRGILRSWRMGLTPEKRCKSGRCGSLHGNLQPQLRFWSGCVGIATATGGTISSSILRRIGGARWCATEWNCHHIMTLSTAARWKFCDSIRVCRMLLCRRWVEQLMRRG
mgnify:CR=1 FL=1